MIKWIYTKNRDGKIVEYTYILNKNTILNSFRDYYLEYVENNIDINPNKMQKECVSMQYFWKYAKKNKIKDFYEFLDYKDNFIKYIFSSKDINNRKYLNKNSARKILTIINNFIDFCHKKDSNFSPKKNLFYREKYNVKDLDFIDLYNKSKKFRITFDEIHEKYKEQYKRYIKYRINKKNKISTIYSEHRTSLHLWRYINTSQKKEILNFKENDVLSLINYIKCLSNTKSGGVLSLRMQSQIYGTIKAFITFLSSEDKSYKDILLIFNDFSIVRKNVIKTESIQEDILKKIVQKVKTIQNNSKLKTFILISANYGLRISDILDLKITCLKKIENRYDFKYYINKSNKYKTINNVSQVIVNCLKELINDSKKIREESNLDYLFLIKHTSSSRVNEIRIVSSNWLNRHLNKFIIENNILMENNEIPYITSKMFRRTLPSIYEKKGISLQTAQNILGHSDISTTDKYYNRTNEYEYIKSMEKALDNITIISTPKQKSEEYTFFHNDKQYYNIIEEGYCTNSQYKPDDKICTYLESRGNCYGCPNLVTTPEYIPFFKQQIKNWKRDLKRVNYLNSHVTRHLSWKISLVKEIILRLESTN